LGHGAGPEEARLLELLEDLDRVGNIHRAVGGLGRGVAEFADAGVAGAGVVPAVGGFLRELLGHLVNLDAQLRVEALEQGAEVGGHDAAADQDDIGVFDVRGVFHGKGNTLHGYTRGGRVGRIVFG